ncbi:MAG: hypothetical protein ACTHOH_13355 [Lysobacteraceae bacterium]
MTAEPAIAMSAQDVADRVLRLIENVHNAADLAPQNVEQLTGLKIDVNSADGNDFGTAGRLTDTWYYGLRSMTPQPGEKPNRLLFQFNDQTHADADMTPVCVPITRYASALTAAGFESKQLRNRLDTQDYWEFSRGDIGVTVHVRGQRDPKDPQVCVSMLIINAFR